MSEPLFVSPREAARILGIGRTETYRLLHIGELPHLRVGRNYRIPRTALEAFAQALCRRGPSQDSNA